MENQGLFVLELGGIYQILEICQICVFALNLFGFIAAV